MELRDPSYIKDFLTKGYRFDGRKFEEIRKLVIKTNVVENAEGSCLVELGETKVIAGVKLEIGQPFPDTPDEGYFVVNVEYAPFCMEGIEPGPPGEDEIEIARVIDRVIRESGAIDLKKLCIKEGEKVWGILIDVYVLNNDGNLIDAGTIASVCALLTARFPKYDEEKDRIIYEEKTEERIPITKIPLNITIAKIGDKFIVDPTRLEEEAADSLLTVGVCEGKINSIQKRGREGLSFDEIKNCIKLSLQKYEEIRKVIENEVLKGERS